MQDPPLGLRRGAEPIDVPQWFRLSGGPSKIHPRLRLRLFVSGVVGQTRVVGGLMQAT